ncbi:MAG: response regulator [Deltaproteobacteria bacterium]|nr:response regulator [Deltaproteobacteria bacterium]MBW2041159.1 response regulator [Deltaproteobacteria bacterium]MBW2131943.1 response regulator [Deltaproteobacteria bacterium]
MRERTLLLVDDEVEFVQTLAERLQLRGFQVYIAHDGDEALIQLEKSRFDMVILDVMMPGLGGLDVLKQMKPIYPETPVILLTGRGSTNDGIEGMRLGARDYLMKPINIDELIKKIGENLNAT